MDKKTDLLAIIFPGIPFLIGVFILASHNSEIWLGFFWITVGALIYLKAGKSWWIALGVSMLICLAYSFGKDENRVLTPQEKSDAISECIRWGGQVIYDSNHEYQDCTINNRID